MRRQIKDALIKGYGGEIAKAKANIEVYMRNPVGIGEHPDIVAAIDSEVEKAATAQETQDFVETLSD